MLKNLAFYTFVIIIVQCIVNKKMDKIIIYKTLYLSNTNINPDTLEAFSFANIDIVYKKISPFFQFFVQVAVEVIKIFTIFNSNLGLNASSFSYVAK